MTDDTSRLTPMKRCTCLLLTLALSFSLAHAQPAETGEDAVDVLIVGGGTSHDFARWFGAVDSTLLDEAGADVEYTERPKHVRPALQGLDVLYLSNNQPLPGSDVHDAVFYHLGAGRGLMIGHAAAWYNWDDWPAYNRDLVSGGTRSHRAYGEFEVTVEDAEHPVTQGVSPTFTLEDELYRFEKDPEGPPIHVLASAEEPETGDVYPVVWTVHHTNGRIVVNTLGHDGAAHDHPDYQRLLKNSLRWAGRQVEAE